MPRRDWRAFLEDVVQSARQVRLYTEGLTFEQYVADAKTRDANERQLGIMGEAVNHWRRLRPDQTARMGNVEGMVKVRNIMVHGYFGVQHDKVWSVVQNDLVPPLSIAEPLLRAELERPEETGGTA